MHRKEMKVDMQSGVVLPTVLWITLVSIVMAAGYSATVRLNTRTFLHVREAVALKHAASAGVYTALERLLNNSAVRPAFAGRDSYSLQLADTRIHVSIEPEWSKVSLNKASAGQLQAAIMNAGIDGNSASVLAQRIVDWRDRDSFRSVNGMEDEDYYGMGRHFGAKDSAINDLQEVNMIAGMSAEIFRAIEPGLTVYDSSAGNIVTVRSRAVSATGEATVKAIIRLTRSSGKPYSVLKWYYNEGVV